MAFTHMIFGADGSTYPVNSVTDTQGNAWIPAGNLVYGVQLWYALNCKAGANTVTAHSTSSSGYWFFSIAEFSGVFPTGSVIEAYNWQFGNGTAASVSQLVPSSSDLIFSYFVCEANSPPETFSGYTGGFTQEEAWSDSDWTGQWADNAANPSSAGVVTAGATASGATQWEAFSWAFRTSGFVPATNLAHVRDCTESIKSGAGVSTTSPAIVNFACGNDAGNSILVTIMQYSTLVSDGVTGITDSNGNTYARIAQGAATAGNLGGYCSVWAAKNIVGSPLLNTISVAYSAAVNDSAEVYAAEFAGNFVLDTSGPGSGNGGSGTITAAAAGALLLSTFSLSSQSVQSFVSSVSPTTNLTLYRSDGHDNSVNLRPGPNLEQVVAYGVSTLGSNTISIASSEGGYAYGAGAFTVALIPAASPSGAPPPSGIIEAGTQFATQIGSPQTHVIGTNLGTRISG